MTHPGFLSGAIDAWAAFHGDHQMVSLSVRYLHVAGLMVGGGTALAADRQLMAARRAGPAAQAAALAWLRGSHRVVVPALLAIGLSGLLMTASDTGTFLVSRIYALKVGLVALLVLNGIGLLAAGRAASSPTRAAQGWRWLGIVSVVSLLLWLAIPFVGLWLTVAA